MRLDIIVPYFFFSCVSPLRAEHGVSTFARAMEHHEIVSLSFKRRAGEDKRSNANHEVLSSGVTDLYNFFFCRFDVKCTREHKFKLLPKQCMLLWHKHFCSAVLACPSVIFMEYRCSV